MLLRLALATGLWLSGAAALAAPPKGAAAPAGNVRGTVSLPDQLRTSRDGTSGYWRLENGVVPIGAPHRSVFQDTVIVFELGVGATPTSLTATVEITGIDFSPRVLPVQTGTTIEFKNLDRFAHNLYSPGNDSFFKNELTPPGGSRKVRFFAPGATNIRCAEFPHMEGAVLVLPQLHYARPDASGAFTAQLPEGRYTMRVFVRNRWVHQQALEVGAAAQELKIKVAPPKERE